VRAGFASANRHKLEELRRALPDWELALVNPGPFPPETGQSYYENAVAKARFGRRADGTSDWVLGEDSGIEVDGLGGAPGIRSARWAGDADPVEALLEALAGTTGAGRRARYVCELVAVGTDGSEQRGTGVLEGHVADRPAGDEGFGYDPVFVPDGEERTVAQLGNRWKTANSHRARAAAALGRAISASTAHVPK
jgi:XTP/dITP diphosphohydrolase